MSIEEVFDTFVTALEKNRMELLETVLDEKVEIYSSAHGIFTGRKEAKEQLAWKGEPLDYSKIRIFNNVIRRKGDFAAQSAYFVVLIGKEVNGFMNHFQCAFLTTIEYHEREEGFQITKVRANMTFECGNSLLVSKQWNMIDYGIFKGNTLNLIRPEDSPWDLVKDTDDVMTEEDKIKECFRRYNWLIDVDDWDRLPLVATENLYLLELGEHSRQDWIEMLRNKREKELCFHGKKVPKEACWNHISSFKEIRIKGDVAEADIYRFEPNRIGTRFLHKYNMDTLYYSCTWHMTFAKTAEDVWKMDHFGYEASIVEDNESFNRRYF